MNKMLRAAVAQQPVSAPPKTILAEIPEQLNILERRVESLEAVCSELEERISPVSREPEPETPCDRPKEPAAGTKFGSCVQEMNRRLECVYDRLNRLINRLGI